MKKNEFESMDKVALTSKIEELRREYFQLHEDVMYGKVGNSASLKVARRQVARAKTALSILEQPKKA